MLLACAGSDWFVRVDRRALDGCTSGDALLADMHDYVVIGADARFEVIDLLGPNPR